MPTQLKRPFLLASIVCSLAAAMAAQSIADDREVMFVSPDATFNTTKQAMMRGDYETFCQCFSDDGLRLMTGSLRMMTGMIEWAGKQENADKRSVKMAKGLVRINRRYVESQPAAEIQFDLNASAEELMASIRKRAEPINDHSGYIAAIFKLLRANDNRPNKFVPMADAQLLNLKTEGESATAMMSGTFLKPQKSENSIVFRRVGLAWKIEQLGDYGTNVSLTETSSAPAQQTTLPEKKPKQKRRQPRPKKMVLPVLPEVSTLKPIDRPNEKGFSQLHQAGSAEVPQALIDQGADVDVRQRTFHGTPLQYAASFGRLDVVRLLLKHKATVDAVDLAGRTPLMWAASKGHAEIVEALLEAGASPEQTSRGTKWTALHFAAEKGQFETAQLLIEHGASPAVKNTQGKTPLDLNPNIAPPR